MSSNGTDAPAEAQAAVEEPVVQVRGLSFREPCAAEFCGSLLGTEGASQGRSQEVSLPLSFFSLSSFCL